MRYPASEKAEIIRLVEQSLEEQVGRFVEHYNHARPHESLSNLTPADVYFGRGEAILAERKRIKK